MSHTSFSQSDEVKSRVTFAQLIVNVAGIAFMPSDLIVKTGQEGFF